MSGYWCNRGQSSKLEDRLGVIPADVISDSVEGFRCLTRTPRGFLLTKPSDSVTGVPKIDSCWRAR